MSEKFKKIPGYEDYQVSNFGNVKSLKFGKERILKAYIDTRGYLIVCLLKNQKRKQFQVHQLVAITFLNHKPDGHNIVVDHIDNDKLNNKLENLQLITNRENSSKDIDKSKTSSKYTGVYWNKRAKKYKAGIRINGKIKHLGYFDCETLASINYELELKKINNGIY